MNEISVPVKLQIQNLQSLMSDLQGKLSNLKVGSAGFKNLQNVISAIGNEIDRLQVQTSKPFMSEAQFKTAERSVEKLEDQIEKLGLSVSRIKFSDLNLTPQQQSDIKGFEDQLESIKANLKMVKDTAKQEFLKTDLGQQWATIDSTAFSKSLSQITANIRSEVKKQQDELNKLQETATSYQNALKQNNSIKKFLQNTNKDPISANSMGKNLYDQLFDKNGVLKGGKNSGKKLIEQWLEQQLELDPQIISRLVNNLKSGAGRDISAQLTAALQKIMKDNSAVIKANPTAEVDFKQKEQEVQNLINILREAGVSEQSIVVAEQALRQQLDNTKQSFNEYQQAAARAAQEHMNIDSTTAAFKSQLTSLRSTLDQTNARFLQMQRTTQSFNQMKMAITNFMGFNQVLNITKNAVREAMNHIKELDSVMNGISIVTDMTTDDLWKQVDAYSEMAQNYGVSIKGAYEVSQIYYQQGLETNDVLTLTNETLKLAKISGLDYAQTTDYMTTALRGFKMEMSDASTIVDVYSNLAANTAVSQEELAVAMSKTASSMESVGSTFEDTSAMIATMVAVTRESATNIGSAMKSIASRYGELTKDPTKLVDADGEAMAFNKVDSALQSVGISMKTVDGQFRSFTEVIVELAEKWDQLESTQQRYIATQFAGNRQQSRFLALVSNKDILKANMEVANNSEDVGTLQALKALDSIEVKTEQVRVAYQQFYTTIGMQDVWKTFLDGTKNVINTLNRLPKLFNTIPLGAIGAIANVINLVKGLLTTSLSWFAKFLGPIINNSIRNTAEEAEKTAEGIPEGISRAIKKGEDKIVNATAEAVGKGTQRGIEQGTQQAMTVLTPDQLIGEKKTQYNQNQNLIERLSKGQNDKFMAEAIAVQLKAEQKLSDEQYKAIMNSSGGATSGVQQLINKLKEENQALLTVQQTTEQSTGKFNQFINSLKDGSSKASRNLSSVAMALTTVGMVLNKDTEAGRIASGVFTGLGGALQTGLAGVRVFSGDLSALPQLVMGLINVFNGFSLAIETPAERLERLNKVAKELSNKAKEEKANYNVLNRSIEKLEELKGKRYESAEAAEEYQTAVDELAEKFPEMIAGFDEAGNIILDTTDKERILTEAREKAAQATYDAAKAEMDAAKDKVDTAKNKVSTSLSDLQDLGESAQLYSQADVEFQIYESLRDYVKNKINELDQVKDYNKYTALSQLFQELFDNYSYDSSGHFISDNLSLYLERLKNIGYDDYSYNEVNQSSVDEYFNELNSLLNRLNKMTPEEILNDSEDTLGQVENLLDNVPDYLKDGLIEVKDSFTDLQTQLKNYVSENTIYKAYSKQVISAWQQSASADTEAWETLSKSGQAAAIVTKQIVADIGNNDYEKAKEEGAEEGWRERQQTMANWLSTLSDEEIKLFDKMVSDSKNYSADDIIDKFEIKNDDIKQLILNYYTNGITSIQERLQNSLAKVITGDVKDLDEGSFLKQYYNLITDTKKGETFAGIDENYLTSILTRFQNLKDSGLEKQAEEFGKQALTLYEFVTNAPYEIQSQLWKLILDNGITTLEGIQKIQEGIERNSDLKNYAENEAGLGINKALTGISETMVANIASMSQALLAEAQEEVEKTGKLLGKASQQMSHKEASNLIDYMTSIGMELNYDSFDSVNGKLVLKYQKFNELQEAYQNYLEKRLESVDKAIKQSEELLVKNEETGQVEAKHITQLNKEEIEKNENLKKFLSGQRINVQEDLKYNELGQLTSESVQLINDVLDAAAETYNDVDKANRLLLNTFIQESNWAKGIYDLGSGALNELELRKLVNTKWDKNHTEERGAQDYIKEHYNTFVTDVLKKGFENINMDDYEGLYEPDEIKKDLTGSYVNFLNKYGQYLGLSVEELNDLIGEAIEKDKAPLDGAAREALEKVDFYKGINGSLKGIADYETIQGLADALQVSVNDLLGNYIRQLDQYEIKLDNKKLSTALNRNTELIADSINSVFNSITKYINSGLEGKLQIKDRNNFIAQLKELGITGIDKIDFTETQDGLKLSQQAAIHLYNELEKIDNIQGKIVFNDLSKELQKSNDHYKSTVDLLTHITDLRKTVAELEKNKDSTKLQQYKEELAVAEQIAKVRATTEDSSFSFMDNKLEGGLNNPVNYLNAWGKANSAWNKAIEDAKSRKESFKKGESFFDDFNVYLDPTDFQNIVEELNRIAGQSGTTIEFLGQKLDGSLEAASALIVKGFNTLTTDAGGQAILNMSALGVSLEDGGKLLNQGAGKAVHEVAKSQIKIIDALINVMETVVALEGLTKDNNGDSEFNINDIFPNPEQWVLDPKFLESIQDLLKNKQIVEELKNYKFDNGKTLNDFFNDLATKQGKELQAALNHYGITTQEDLFNIIKQFEGSNDWEANAQTIYEVLKQWIPKELNYEDEQVETITINGAPIKIDFKEQNVQKALEQFKNGTEEEKKARLKEAIGRYKGNKGTKPLSIENDTEDLIAVLTYKGIVTNVKVDEENKKVTITYNGKEYGGTTKEEALQRAILSEAGGENEVEIKDNNGELTGKIKFADTNITLTAGENGTVHYSLYDSENHATYTGNSLEEIKSQYIDTLVNGAGISSGEAEAKWNESIKVNTSIDGEVQEVTDTTGVNLNTPILTINPEKIEVSSEEGAELPSAEKVSIKVKDLIITGIENALLQEGYDGSLTKPFPQVIADLTSLILSSVLKTSLSDPDNLPSPEAITQMATSLTKLMFSSVGDAQLSPIARALLTLYQLDPISAMNATLKILKLIGSPEAQKGDGFKDPTILNGILSDIEAQINSLKIKANGTDTSDLDTKRDNAVATWKTSSSSSIDSVEVSVLALKFALTGATTDEVETKIKEYNLERSTEKAVKVTVPLLSFVLGTTTDENGNPTENKNIDDKDIRKAIAAYNELPAGSKTAVLSSLMLSVATENVNSENAKESAVAKLKTLLDSLSIPLDNIDLTLGGINLIAGEIQKDETLDDATKNQIISWISQKLTNYNMVPNVDLSGIFIKSTGNKFTFADGILDDEGRLKLSALKAAVAVTDLKIALSDPEDIKQETDENNKTITITTSEAALAVTGIKQVAFKTPITTDGSETPTITITDANGEAQTVTLNPNFDFSNIINPKTGKINQQFVADVFASLKDNTVEGWKEWVEDHSTFTVTPVVDNSQDSNNNELRDKVYLGTHSNETYKYLDPQRKTVQYEAEVITSNWYGSSIGKEKREKTVYSNDSDVVTYLNNLRTAVGEYNETLSQIDLENLNRLKSVLSGAENESGEDLGKVIQDIISLNQINLSNKTEEIGALAEIFQGIDAENLSKAVESMILLASSATSLDKIDWDAIVAGINGINSINTPNFEPNSSDGSNDGVPDDNSIEKKINLDLKLSGDTSAQELIQKQEEPIQRTIELNVTDENINNIISKLNLGLYGNNDSSQGNDFTNTETSSTVPGVDTTGIQSFIDSANKAGEEINAVAKAAQEIKNDKVKAIQTAQDEISNNKVEAVKNSANAINTTPAFNARAYINSIDPSRAQAAQEALNNITGNVAIDVQFNVGIDGAAEATGNIVGARLNGQNINYSPYSVNTKINKSYAKGSRRTLMGELGPELVVSGGRYYVVGQNGAEMVDLDPDAIVFNHIQTKKLLSTGHAGRGNPITNERTAVSLATGTAGPAMASASAVLSELKKIRAMWESMLKVSLKDLGSQAGLNTKLSNKKNNGGSGNSNNDKPNTVDAGYIADLERWYNLLRQIDKLEKDINYQEQLRSKIESDRAINGKAYYESQKQSLKEIEEEVIARHQLVVLQKSYYDKRREELTESPFGKIFTFNEDGLMQYNDQGLMPNGERGGLAALAKLNATNPDNSSVFTPREQYNLLVEWGYGDLLKYDNSGKLIEFTDDKGNPREEGYVEAVQSFWDQADGIKEELDSLYDSYRDQQEQILAADQKRNEILQNIVNNQLAVEDKVYKALVDLKESEIENAEKEKDALQKSSDEFIDGLNSQLNKEREMYKNNQEEVELTKLRRQLAILRRSGGSASQIRGLQDQISAKEQDQYFNAQQQQIDAVKEASDLQIKKMDQQITIMRETLEYQKAQGLLYGEVSKIMSGSAESINSFITTFDKDWKAYSATKWQEEYNLLNSQTTQWASYLQDETGYRETASGALVTVQEALTDKEGVGYSWRVYDEAMYKLFGEDWNEVKGQVKSIYDGHYGETADPNFAATKATETQEVQNLITGDDNTIYLNPEGDGDIFNQPEDDDYLGGNSSNSDYGGNYGNSSYSTPSVKIPKKQDKKSEKPVVISTGDWESDDTHHWRTQQLSDGNTRMAYYAKHKYSGPITNGSKCNVCGRMVTSYSPINTPTKPDTEPNSPPSGTYKTSYPNQAIYDDGTVYHNPNQSSSSGNLTNSKGTIKVYHIDMNGNSLVKKVVPQTFTQGRTIKGEQVRRTFNNYVYDHSEPYSITVVGGQSSQMFCYYRKIQTVSPTRKPNSIEKDSIHSIMGLSTGGMVDYTGLAMLHGSKARPEAVLNADETKMWREKILSGHSNSLTNQLLNFQNLVNGLSLNLSGVNNTTNEGSVNIERIEFNMNASIANDYDAKRAGQNAFEEMMKIARKNGVQSVSRR